MERPVSKSHQLQLHSFHTITLDTVKVNIPFVGNIGHFDDEFDLARLGAWKA